MFHALGISRLSYHQCRPEQLIAEITDIDYPNLNKTRSLVAEETNLKRGTKEYRKTVEEWFEESQEMFWAGVVFKQRLELRDGTALKVRVV